MENAMTKLQHAYAALQNQAPRQHLATRMRDSLDKRPTIQTRHIPVVCERQMEVWGGVVVGLLLFQKTRSGQTVESLDLVLRTSGQMGSETRDRYRNRSKV